QPDGRAIVASEALTSANGRSRSKIARLQSSSAPEIFNVNNGFSFDVGAVAGVTYGVQASTNLTNWNTVLTTNAAVDVFHYVDGGSGQFPQIFFRVFR